MNVGTILNLAKAGYKPGEISELAQMEKQQPGTMELAASCKSLDDVKNLLSLVTSEDGESPEEAAGGPAEREPETDYKSQIEDQQKKIADLEAQLKAIQGENARKNVAGEPAKDPEAVLSEIVSSFM